MVVLLALLLARHVAFSFRGCVFAPQQKGVVKVGEATA